MNKYEILKHEYDVKRITASEVEAVAQILVKCDFNHDVEEWVWTGNTGALLKNYPGLPQVTNDTLLKNYPQAQVPQMGQSPVAQDAHAQGGMAPVQSHMQPGGMFGGAKTTLHDPTGGNTMSGTRRQMMRQARGTAEGSPQRRMMEQQYGQMDPSAGERLSSAMGSAGSWLKNKFGQAKEKGSQLATAAGDRMSAAGDRMSAGFAGAGAGLDSAVQGTKGFLGRMRQGMGDAWGAAKEGFANEMDRRQGQFDGGGARRQGTTDQQRAATFDDSALLGAGWSQQQIDTMRGATGGATSPAASQPAASQPAASQPAASQPAGGTMVPPQDDYATEWAADIDPNAEARPGMPSSGTMVPPQGGQMVPPQGGGTMVPPQGTSSATGQVAASSNPAHFGPLKEGSAPARQWMASQQGDPEDPMSGWDSAHAANESLRAMEAGEEYDPATMRPGPGHTKRTFEGGRKQFHPELARKMLKAYMANQSSSFNHAWDNLLKGL